MVTYGGRAGFALLHSTNQRCGKGPIIQIHRLALLSEVKDTRGLDPGTRNGRDTVGPDPVTISEVTGSQS